MTESDWSDVDSPGPGGNTARSAPSGSAADITPGGALHPGIERWIEGLLQSMNRLSKDEAARRRIAKKLF